MGWEECIVDGYVKKTFVDKQRAKSLTELSNAKLKFVGSIKITEDNSSILFSDMYDSLLEICQSIACLEGYKILNHECIKYMLERLDLKTVAEKFDRFRKVRNRINYYGKRVDVNFSESSIREMEEIISYLRVFMKRKYKNL